MRRQLLILLAILLTIPTIALAYDVGYGYEGTFSFNCSAITGPPACPSNMSYAYVSMAGGGGSGKSTTWWTGIPNQNAFGYGGEAGDYGNITMVPISYTTAYPIVVGGHGDTSTVYNTSNAGGASSAFGHVKAGGAGGGSGSSGTTAGGDGESTNFLTSIFHPSAIFAAAGGNSGAYNGGLAGTGWGSGGGGAGSNASLVYDVGQAIGGNGGDGIVYLWDMNGSASNVPSFSASPTNTGLGTAVIFTDGSILNDAANLTYNWSFGDGTVSNTRGSVTHVYSNYGVYTVNLTLTSDVSTVFYERKDYITITNVPVTAWYQQKLVRIKIVDHYGGQLRGANITINYISNTLPSQDVTWLTTAFGVSQTTAAAMTNSAVAMQGLTDVDGSSVFMMFPAIQYGISITNTTLGLSKYITLNPQDTDYIIQCELPSQVRPTSVLTYLANASLYVTSPNASYITWNILYSDISGYTTALTWNVTCLTNGTEMYTKTWGAIGTGTTVTDSYTFPSEPIGVEYKALYDATRSW